MFLYVNKNSLQLFKILPLRIVKAYLQTTEMCTNAELCVLPVSGKSNDAQKFEIKRVGYYQWPLALGAQHPACLCSTPGDVQ